MLKGLWFIVDILMNKGAFVKCLSPSLVLVIGAVFVTCVWKLIVVSRVCKILDLSMVK